MIAGETRDTGSSIFFMLMGGFLAWKSIDLSIGSIRAPGPGFFPFVLSLLLIGLAFIIFLQALKKEARPLEKGLKRSRVAIALGAIILYALLMDPLGYLISTFLLILLLLKIMARKAWWWGPAVACIVTVISYALFKIWLQVLLPDGILRF